MIKNNEIKNSIFFKLIIISFIFFLFLISNINKNTNIKIAVCTMGKQENLYVKEFVDYYINLGVDHIFIYDDNNNNTEKFENVLGNSYCNNVTIYDNNKLNIKYQAGAFNHCYKNNNKNFDWLLMIDMDEFLYIVEDKLKHYLNRNRFNKCDFILFNWVIVGDNNLVHYDNRTLFERFKPPYIKSIFIKTIVRGNIKFLEYDVHFPARSPIKNITCNSAGKKIEYRDDIEGLNIDDIEISNAYIIHFKYKSTEEYINKYKRGYSYFDKEKLKQVLNYKIEEYLRENKVTLEKINMFEKELNINLSSYKTI